MSQTPLFVRLPSEEAEKLDRAAFELKMPKARLVADLVARYVDPSRPEALAGLRALPLDEDRAVVGRYAFRPTDESDVLTVEEVARLLRVGEHTVRKLAAAGDLPGRKIGRGWRFSRRAVLDWLAAPERTRAGFRR